MSRTEPVFADSSYWIAMIFPHDTHHTKALRLSKQLTVEKRRVVTSQMVLTEFLNFFASFGSLWRDTAIQFVESILADTNTTVIEQTGPLFMEAMGFYAQRADKEWGQTGEHRSKMAGDLIRKYLKPGMSAGQITLLLGTPERRPSLEGIAPTDRRDVREIIEYDMGHAWDMAGQHYVLSIYFGERGRYLWAEATRD